MTSDKADQSNGLGASLILVAEQVEPPVLAMSLGGLMNGEDEVTDCHFKGRCPVLMSNHHHAQALVGTLLY